MASCRRRRRGVGSVPYVWTGNQAWMGGGVGVSPNVASGRQEGKNEPREGSGGTYLSK